MLITKAFADTCIKIGPSLLSQEEIKLGFVYQVDENTINWVLQFDEDFVIVIDDINGIFAFIPFSAMRILRNQFNVIESIDCDPEYEDEITHEVINLIKEGLITEKLDIESPICFKGILWLLRDG